MIASSMCLPVFSLGMTKWEKGDGSTYQMDLFKRTRPLFPVIESMPECLPVADVAQGNKIDR
jgi:hypothetical protein